MTKPEKMGEFFKARVNGYDEHMRMNVAGFEKLYTVISDPINSTMRPLQILDLGCGTGLELKAIFKKIPNALITGIDLSQEMLTQLRKKYSNKKNQLSLILGSYLDYQFPDNTYDYALSAMTLHHLNHAEKGLLYKNIFKTLKEEGTYLEADYVVSTLEETDRLERYHELKRMYDIKDMYNYHIDIPFSKQHQTELLKHAGFRKVEIILELENACVFNCKK